MNNLFNTFTKTIMPKHFTGYIEYPKLGRWNIQYNNNIIYCKIDQANKDNSIWYSNEFENYTENNDDKKPLHETDEYLVPYCM